VLAAKREADVLLEHRASIVLAESKLMLGKTLEARAILQPFEGKLGFDHELKAQAVLGWTEMILGETSHAIKAFERTLPWGPEAQLGRALSAWYTGKTREALSAAQVAVETSPDGFKKAQMQIVLGLALWTRGQYSDNLEMIAQALSNPALQPQQRSQALLARSPTYVSRGEYDHAFNDIQIALQTATSTAQIADAENQLGLIYAACGDLERGLQFFAQSIQRCETSHDVGVLIPRGLRAVLLALHKDPRHIEAAKEALLLHEHSPHALGRCYALLGAAESAYAQGQRASAVEYAERLKYLALEYEMPEMRAFAQLLIGLATPDQNALESALMLGQSIGLTIIIARAATALKRHAVAEIALELLLERIQRFYELAL
jgi:tetratricopeptide (TPR) repeat protein